MYIYYDALLAVLFVAWNAYSCVARWLDPFLLLVWVFGWATRGFHDRGARNECREVQDPDGSISKQQDTSWLCQLCLFF